ncbi:MAG: hypothetical protein WCK55_07850 [Verrucomicrobiota bacterium]
MHTFADLARTLNRSPVYLRGLQTRFALPVLEGAAYPAAYLAFLRTVIFLRTFGVSEDALLRLWNLETKLLTLLHVDSTGSPTWFLNACGQKTCRKRRLLLTNHDLGVAIPARMLQLGLNFGDALPELFAGKEMGEDALRVLEKYLTALAAIRREVGDEIPHVSAALSFARQLVPQTKARRSTASR